MIDIGVKRKKWDNAKIAAKLKAATDLVIKNISEEFRDEIKSTITKNLAEGPPLSAYTVARKGHGIKLLETGELRNSVVLTGSGRDTLVGIPRSSPQWRIGKIHEYGDPSQNIPQRSFIRSTWKRKRDHLLMKARAELQAMIL